MPNVLYSNESLSRYLKNGFVIESETDEIAILVKRRKVGVFWNLVLTLLTGGFWLLVWIPRLIFRNSVVRLYKNSLPQKAPGFLGRLINQGLDKFQSLSIKGKLITVGGLGLVLLFFIISGSATQKAEIVETQASDYSTYKSSLESPVDVSTCTAVESVLESGEAATFAKKNLARATKAADTLTVWNADSYLAKSDWVGPAVRLMDDLEAELEAETNPLLKTRIKGLDAPEAEAGLEKIDGTWGDRFRSFVISDCDLEEIATNTRTSISEVVSASGVIQYKASSKPWYPKGFEETGFEGFAFQNISNQGCRYSFGSCAKFKIVSKTDCPTNLYVKTNHLVNGEVDDWSNDTATVSAGQVAIMETTFNSDYSGSWQFVEINCY